MLTTTSFDDSFRASAANMGAIAIDAWMQLCQAIVPHPRVIEDGAILLVVDARFFVTGWMRFETLALEA